MSPCDPRNKLLMCPTPSAGEVVIERRMDGGIVIFSAQRCSFWPAVPVHQTLTGCQSQKQPPPRKALAESFFFEQAKKPVLAALLKKNKGGEEVRVHLLARAFKKKKKKITAEASPSPERRTTFPTAADDPSLIWRRPSRRNLWYFSLKRGPRHSPP